MLGKFCRLFAQKQPVSYTGVLTHTFYWLTSPANDLVYKNPHYKPVEGQAGVAIYCVHGTADRPAAFTRIAERLIEQGLPEEVESIHLVSFEGRGQGLSINDFSSQLIKKIKINKHQRVMFMGHSRGGLVVTKAAEDLAEEGDIEPLLCIGICAPYSGSYLALPPLSWFSSSVSEMELDSPFLDELNKKLLTSKIPHHFVEALEDGIVPVEYGYAKSYLKEHPNALSRYARHGHLSIMSSHDLVKDMGRLMKDVLHPLPIKKGEEFAVTLGESWGGALIEDYEPTKATF
ncbi:alpha/beta hydrolase [Legionella sp. MW5194]|uniref:alpha/beta hydrolase n=1 Tax=Legionella sp. MW5194 TaxID=2662448 RepID=UPI00193D8802|nr:alpha/beta hydrolase [Legionella sp. MW5194]QRN03345.1 alpha/beta hydrolase [Legionella sp. MW5194]